MMNKRKVKLPRWRDLDINKKLGSVFALLLLLIAFVAMVGQMTLSFVRRETEATILTNAEIQGLVLEMDQNLQEARVLQRDFFWRYPRIGLTEARQIYASKAVKKMADVLILSEKLQQRLSVSQVSNRLQKHQIDLNLYFSTAERYTDTFIESVELVTQLAATDTGLETLLNQSSMLLQESIQLGDHDLTDLYRDMQSLTQDYLFTRQRPSMQSALNIALQLSQSIQDTPSLGEEQKAQALTHLDNYRSIAQNIIELDVAIRRKLDDFDLQTQAVNPISAELVVLAAKEVEQSRTGIARVNQLAMGILVTTTLVLFFAP